MTFRWVPPSLGDLNRLVNSVEQGIHAKCPLELTVHDGDVWAHFRHSCGLLPEVVPMKGGDNHD